MSIEQKLYWTKGVEHGIELERERVIKLLDIELVNCECEAPLTHLDARIREKINEQPNEVNCFHGIGHKEGIHGCDGCCTVDNQTRGEDR